MIPARPLLRFPLSALGLVCVLSACPSTVTPTPPVEKPQVAIHMPMIDVVGEDLSFTVNVSGCDTLQTLEIYDGSQFIKSVPPSLPQTEVTVLANELDYSRGFALSVAFRARAVCSDGRENLSRAQAATYMPVERVFLPPPGDQFVTDLFTVEGHGDEATFIGCTWNETYSQTTFVRVDQTGAVVKESLAMPFSCTHLSQVSERHPVTGKRWLWDPVGGAVAINDALAFSGQYLGALDGFLVDPASGDGVVIPAFSDIRLRRIRHDAPNSAVWDEDLKLNALPKGLPAMTPLGLMVPAETWDLIPEEVNTLSVFRIDVETGSVVGQTDVLNGTVDAAPYSQHEHFTMTVKEDGARVYVPRLGLDGKGTVRACSTEVADCSQAPGLLWESPPHGEWPSFIRSYANGTRVLVASAFWVMVLEASTGERIGEPINPTGAQYFSDVVFGEGESFYLLTSPTQDDGSVLPIGVVAVDDPVLGPVFRYNVRGGSLALSLDEEGATWMRVGAKLAKALPLSDYRAALERGTAPGN